MQIMQHSTGEFMKFTKINMSDKEKLDYYLAKTQYNGSDYSILYLAGWDYFNFPSMQIAIENDILYLRFKASRNNVIDDFYTYLAPLTNPDRALEGLNAIKMQCELENQQFYVISCSSEFVEQLDDSFIFDNSDDLDEYLYNPESFIALEGKKYHQKRNFLTKFEHLYGGENGYIFRPYQEQDREKVFKLLNIWQDSKHGSAMISNEEKVIKLALELLNSKGFYAGVIEYHGEIIAFSVGETTASNIGVTHIEKANTEYEGAYIAIANNFARAHFSNCRYINRQEDMGIEGLRKSKMSYRPIEFARKFRVKLK